MQGSLAVKVTMGTLMILFIVWLIRMHDKRKLFTELMNLILGGEADLQPGKCNCFLISIKGLFQKSIRILKNSVSLNE